MKRKVIFFVASLVMLQVVNSGCASREAAIDSPSQETKGIPPAESPGAAVDQTAQAAYRDGLGVVNDTVVDVFRAPDTKSERLTQAIFNQPVEILDRRENWLNVKVVDGYSGWVRSKYVDTDACSLKGENCRFRIVVTAKTKKVCAEAGSGVALKEVVMGTELYSTGQRGGWYEVALPGGRAGWVDGSGCIRVPLDGHIPQTNASDFIFTAKKLKGAVYLWGGISSWGIDCSGLTYICSRVNGVDLPRDADEQFKVGKTVAGIEFMEPGDLIFLSSNEKRTDVSHVMIYMGNNQVIQASSSKGAVVIGPFAENDIKKILVGIKRIFP